MKNYFYGTLKEPKTLQVRIGPSIDTLQLAKVNCENDPHFIDSPYFVGNVLIRIKGFKGVGYEANKDYASEKYFRNKKRLFALQLTGRFKHVNID